MIRKTFVVAAFVSVVLIFQRSWFSLISLAVFLFFGYEQYVRAKMLEYRRTTTPGKLETRLSFLPYSEEQFNKDLLIIIPSLKLRMAVWDERATLHSPLIKFHCGLRKTSFVPLRQLPTNKIYLFGGSTTLCIEVPDDYTIASQLQKNILSGSPPLNDYEVINCGVRGASLRANYEHFNQLDFQKDDICLFFFGCNEFNEINWQPLIGKFQQNLDRFQKLGLLTPSRIFSKFLNFDENYPQINERAQEVEKILTSIRLRCERNKISFIAILQPDMFSRVPASQFDNERLWHYKPQRNVFKARQVLNDKINNLLKMQGFFVDGRSIFNQTDLDVYIDWVHTNYLGNKVIADYFHSVIQQQLPGNQ